MAAILAGGIAANLTGLATTQLFGGQPTRSATPSKSPSAKPTRSTTPTARTTPTAPDPGKVVGLAAALEGVRFALNALPDSTAKTALLDDWERASARIMAGQAPKATLAAFNRSVRDSGLGVLERQAVLAATGLVGAALG